MYQYFVVTGAISIVMIRPLVLVIICFGFFILLQSLVPKVMAHKGSTKINEILLENQKGRKRKNYVVRLDQDNDILRSIENMGTGTTYDNIPFPSDTNPEQLSAFIVDYANMIRDDVVLLDNSVETRTRKRGNFKIKKDNHAIPDPPCNCKYIRQTKDLGANSYPRYVETKNCSEVQQTCLPPYICKENLYELTVIRRRESRSEYSLEYPNNLPNELKYKWIAEKRPISVGCVCTRDYIKDDTYLQ